MSTSKRKILVVVGTDHHSFSRLINWADARSSANPDEDVFVQHGHSAGPLVADGAPFLSPADLGKLAATSDIVIVHGGPGTMMEMRRQGHLPLAVPRDPAYDEHVDDHQMRFGAWAARKGLLRMVDISELDEIIDAEGSTTRSDTVGAEGLEHLDEVGSELEKMLARHRSSQPITDPDDRASDMSARKPLVSVVIATRDRPEMVREAIASVASQDYTGSIETIVVFDQSEPDATLECTDEMRSVRVITNSRQVGLAGARNTGIEHSSGDYVAFCDDDDYWLPGKITAQVAAMSLWPDATLATTGIQVQYDGQTFDRVLDSELVPMTALLRDRHTELHPSTFFLRRSTIDEVGLVDEQVPGGFGEDYEFLLRNAKIHPIVNIGSPHTVVRWGKQSFFFRRWEMMAAGLTWMLDRYPEFETSRRGSARIRGQIAFAHAAMGDRRRAMSWAFSAVARSPRELRAPLAAGVAAGVVRPDRVMEFLHNRGRGI